MDSVKAKDASTTAGGSGGGGTSAWGPPLWQSMHFIALGYNRTHPEEYIAFYRSLAKAIPCKKCSAHYEEELRRDPVENNMDDLFGWTVKIHNSVNKRLGKEEWTVKRARKHYSHLVFGPTAAASIREDEKTDGNGGNGQEEARDQRELFEQSNRTQEDSDEALRQRRIRRRNAVIISIVVLAITTALLLTAAAYFGYPRECSPFRR